MCSAILQHRQRQGENPGIFVEETLTELEFHRKIYGMTDNAYVRNILKNAVECYVRFAISLPRQETGSADAEYRKGTEWQDGFWQKQEVKSRQLSADELRGRQRRWSRIMRNLPHEW